MNATFEQKIQAWVSIDNQLKLLNEKVQELRDKRNDLSENITKYAQTNNLQNATIQISDGKLKFANTRVTTPLTFKYLEKSLGEVIKNESQVKQIVEYVKENRDSKIVPEIKRLSNK
jgi:seryl-tRNA synthetase